MFTEETISLKNMEREKRKIETHPNSAHLKIFPFKCPSCKKTDIFWFNSNDFLVCSHCRHIWLLEVENPTRRDCK
jgi:ribosomal protein S27E